MAVSRPEQRRGNALLLCGIVLFTQVLSLLTCWGIHSTWGDGIYRLQGPFLVLVGMVLFASQFIMLLAGTFISSRLTGQLLSEANAQTFRADYETKFREVFRPPAELVDEVLREAAKEVREACEAENKLLRHGIGGESVKLTDDPERNADLLGEAFQKQKDLLHGRVQDAKKAFWDKWNLAHQRDYKLKRSWLPYAGLPWTDSVDLLSPLQTLRCK